VNANDLKSLVMRYNYGRELQSTDDPNDFKLPHVTVKEFGWVFEPDRQTELLRNCWGKPQNDKSPIFFYCSHTHPLDESLNHILQGVSRVSKTDPQRFFNRKPRQYPDRPISRSLGMSRSRA
jgi:exodeoxyribonuclease V alpha subunit